MIHLPVLFIPTFKMDISSHSVQEATDAYMKKYYICILGQSAIIRESKIFVQK